MPMPRDLTGQRFGRLIAVCSTNKRARRHVVWLCRCDCGNLKEIESNSLCSGKTKSCGCLQKEIAINLKPNLKHGDIIKGKPKRLYIIWRDILARCLNPNDDSYKYYGKRGIKICEAWLNSYITFRDWAMSHGYSDNLTIDRINHRGNYEPSNCQWITLSDNVKKGWKERKRESHVLD